MSTVCHTLIRVAIVRDLFGHFSHSVRDGCPGSTELAEVGAPGLAGVLNCFVVEGRKLLKFSPHPSIMNNDGTYRRS